MSTKDRQECDIDKIAEVVKAHVSDCDLASIYLKMQEHDAPIRVADVQVHVANGSLRFAHQQAIAFENEAAVTLTDVIIKWNGAEIPVTINKAPLAITTCGAIILHIAEELVVLD